MVWKAKYTKPIIEDKSIRLKRNFALLPKYIDGNYIWLATYETLQVFVYTYFEVTLSNKKQTIQNGNWVNLSDRLCR